MTGSEPAPGSPDARYLEEIGQRPLLTADEEVDLGKQREAGGEAKALLIAGVEDTFHQERLENIVRDGEIARARLIESNRRLVVSVARKYMGRGLPFQDLVQEGNLGLSRAVEKYTPRGVFDSARSAYWWIRQAVTRAIADEARR